MTDFGFDLTTDKKKNDTFLQVKSLLQIATDSKMWKDIRQTKLFRTEERVLSYPACAFNLKYAIKIMVQIHVWIKLILFYDVTSS